MSGLAAVGAGIFLIIAGAFYGTALARARPLFPSKLQDEQTARFALDALIWEHSFPADLRRKYLWAVGFSALAFLCLALAAYSEGYAIAAILFGCLFLGALWHGLARWTKHRDRL
jgi:hypothetical protein